MLKKLLVAGLVVGCGAVEEDEKLPDLRCAPSKYSAECTEIAGSLRVHSFNSYDQIRVIDGDLIIDSTAHSVTSFRDLESIGGSLVITHNENLVEFSAPSLATVSGSLALENNPKLTSTPDWSRIDFKTLYDGKMSEALITVPLILSLRCAAHPACRSVAIKGGRVVAKVATGAGGYFSTEWAERNLCDGSCYDYVFGE